MRVLSLLLAPVVAIGRHLTDRREREARAQAAYETALAECQRQPIVLDPSVEKLIPSGRSLTERERVLLGKINEGAL